MNLITDNTGYVSFRTGSDPNYSYVDIYKTDLGAIKTIVQSTGNTIAQNKVIIYAAGEKFVLDIDAAPFWALSTAVTTALTADETRTALNTYFTNEL